MSPDRQMEGQIIPADLDHHKASASLPLRLSQLELLLPRPAITSYFSIKMVNYAFSHQNKVGYGAQLHEIIRPMRM